MMEEFRQVVSEHLAHEASPNEPITFRKLLEVIDETIAKQEAQDEQVWEEIEEEAKQEPDQEPPDVEDLVLDAKEEEESD